MAHRGATNTSQRLDRIEKFARHASYYLRLSGQTTGKESDLLLDLANKSIEQMKHQVEKIEAAESKNS